MNDRDTDSPRFKPVIRLSRRGLGAAGAYLLAALGPLKRPLDGTTAKGKNKHKKRRKRRKITVCHDRQTISISKNKEQKHLRHGDTLGACQCVPTSQDLQATIDATPSGETIFLCAGSWSITKTLVLSHNITIIGAGAGETALDGGGAVRLLDVTATTACVIKDLTVRHGHAVALGGGIMNAGTLELDGVEIINNTSDALGGGVYNDGYLTARNCTITNNFVKDLGGGIMSGRWLLISDCTISGNRTADYGSGGGLANLANATVTNTQISGNSSGFGGGIDNSPGLLGELFIENGTTISDNTAQSGGGLYNSRGRGTVAAGSRITGNRANQSGGGITNAHDGILSIADSSIVTGNTPNNCALNIPGNCIA